MIINSVVVQFLRYQLQPKMYSQKIIHIERNTVNTQPCKMQTSCLYSKFLQQLGSVFNEKWWHPPAWLMMMNE